MSNMLLSGYLTTAQTVAWTGATQKIDSLTDNEWTNLADEFDNSSTKYPFADVELVLGSAAFTGSDSGIELYIVPSLDGTNWPDWTGDTTSDAPENAAYYSLWLPIKASTSAKRLMNHPDNRIALPSLKFRWAMRNRGNVTLASSGNTLTWRPPSFAI